jgi:hypothetical protein
VAVAKSILPKWFDINNYQKCADFKAVEWLCQLKRRSEVFWGHPDFYKYDDVDRDAGLVLWWGIWETALVRMRAEPLSFDEVSRHLINFSESVRSVVAADFYFQIHRDQSALREGRGDQRKSGRWAVLDKNHSFRDFHQYASEILEIDHYRDGVLPSAVVKVDLNATDSVLLEAFTNWLSHQRRATSQSKRERPAYYCWAGYGLLPYLDLKLWSLEKGIRIPHHVMAQAVGYVKGGDSFRKTVPPLALSLMNNLDELAALEGQQEQLIS